MNDLRAQVQHLLERMNTVADPGEVLTILETMQMIESYYQSASPKFLVLVTYRPMVRSWGDRGRVSSRSP
ncbi:MAG: hypothetical protein ACRDSQ_01760 [Actinokineospora sp.]